MKTIGKIILVTGIVGAGAFGAWWYYKKNKKGEPAAGNGATAGANTGISAGTDVGGSTGSLAGQDPAIPATGGPSYTSPGGAINDFSDTLIGNQGPPPAPVVPELLQKLSEADLRWLDSFCMLPKYPVPKPSTLQSSFMSLSTDTNSQQGRAEHLFRKYQVGGSLSDFKNAIIKYKGC